jgi:D-3-phosphoglycerate dehydrogenase / 2-oxoglutarate reductase
MPKILFTTSSFDLNNFEEYDLMESLRFEIVLNPFKKRLTENQIVGLLDEEVVGIVAGLEPLNDKVLRGAKGLKVISRCGIGLDNVDLNTASELGISVFNTPDAPTRAVAELTISHILSLSRRIVEADRLVRSGSWQPLMGSLIYKQTIGIIGYGRIGKMVASLLLNFGVKIIVHDKFYVQEGNVQSVSLEELLKESDIVSLHLPYSSENHHFINSNNLKWMKQGSLLINIARGGLVDEKALLSEIENGRIGGAAFDCFEIEPYIGPLKNCPTVQISAHMGSYAKESRSMQEAEACVELMKGLRLHGLVSN